MLTKGKNSKFRAVKYAAMVLALVAVLAFCFTSCGKPQMLSAEYLAGTLEKSQYNAGETFDCTGAQMKVTYADGSVETVAVDAAMVGEVTLSYGVTNVEVTYSKDGASVKGLIPVTVVDPLINDKNAAIAAINAKDEVKAGDKGVAAMVTEYVNKINSATTKDGIDALSDDFDTDLSKYLKGKKDALAAIEAVDLSGLYEQFLIDIENAKKVAIANINAAMSEDEAAAFADAFAAAVAKKLNEQEFYEKDEVGQIDQKIDLILLINKYIERAEGYAATIAENDDADKTMGETFEIVVVKLELLKDRVRLAINLDAVKKEFDGYIEGMKTPLDDIYALIEGGHTVKPAPYSAETGALATTDPTKELIEKYFGDGTAENKGLYAAVEAIFGEEGAKKEVGAYRYDLEKPTIDLATIFETIKTKRAELDAKQNAISALNTSVGAWSDTNVPNAATIKAAWAELKKWGAEDAIADTTEAVVFDYKDYDQENSLSWFGAFEIKYFNTESEDAVPYEGVYKVDAWSGYFVDESALETYYFPALDKLVAATQTAATKADDVEELVQNLGTIILSHDKTVDAEQRIKDARTAYNAYIEAYDPDVDADDAEQSWLGVAIENARTTLVAAEEKYELLKTKAVELKNMIAAFYALDAVVLKDYNEVAKTGDLYAAHDAWLAFYNLNSKYTDVIDDADNNLETVNDQYTAQLMACMMKYVELRYTEEVKIFGNEKIAQAYTDAMAYTDKEIHNALRHDLTEKMAELLSKLPAFDASVYAEADLHDIMDILKAELAKTEANAKDLANEFVDFFNEHELKDENWDDLEAVE